MVGFLTDCYVNWSIVEKCRGNVQNNTFSKKIFNRFAVVNASFLGESQITF